MTQFAFRKFCFKALKTPCFIFLLQVLLCFTTRAQSQNLTNVLNALSQPELDGYTVTALEANIIFSRNMFKTPPPNIGKLPDVLTNIDRYVYRFGNGMIYLLDERSEALGKLTDKEMTLVTSNAILEYDYNVEGAQRFANYSPSAQIRRREPNAPTGLQIFFSLDTLHHWIANAPTQSCELGQSSTGQDCYVISVTAPPNVPVRNYKIFLRSDALSPVEFDSYSTDEKISSQTFLKFEDVQTNLSICQTADAQFFLDKKLWRKSFWTVENVEKDNLPLTNDVDSFIPVHAHVWDQRFSKSLNYLMGPHPPTLDQINLMLTTGNYGVAAYEAGGPIHFQPAHPAKMKGKHPWVWIVFIAIVIAPLLVFLPAMLKKS